MSAIVDAMRAGLAAGEPAMLVRVERALGSTPREAGAAMLVTRGASVGTVGGGALELSGVREARAMIAAGRRRGALDIPLGPALGQCCGGRVTLSLSLLDAALLDAETAAEERRRRALPLALIFGAGHTGRALAVALAPLPLRVRLVDERPDLLRDLPGAIEARATALPEAEVAAAPPGSAFLVMTHDHALDFLIAAAALGRRDAAYVGMIGSATKRERFRRFLCEGGEAPAIARLTLPIGGSAVRDKRPAVIAAMTAAEILPLLLREHEENRQLGLAGTLARCKSAQVDNTVKKAARHVRAS